jgi:hypothetical protein
MSPAKTAVGGQVPHLDIEIVEFDCGASHRGGKDAGVLADRVDGCGHCAGLEDRLANVKVLENALGLFRGLW